MSGRTISILALCLSISTLVKAQIDLIDPEIYAEFPGGDEGMFRYLASSLRYSGCELDRGSGTTVIVLFNVFEDGSVGNATVVKGFSPEFDAIALKVICSMPRWKPAGAPGKEHVSTWLQPVSFRSR